MYDKASLALIPSGTKAGSTDNLYSVLPANGNGDFNATRGSTATRVNKDGLIESVAADTPRLDYPITNGIVGNCPHLLLEPSRTNYVPRSVFNAAVPTGWSVGFGTGTFTHELTTFRGQPAIKHTQLTSGRSFLQSGFSFSASTTYTCSFYVDLANCGNITSTETIVNIILDDDTGQTSARFNEIDQDTGFASFTFTTGTDTFGYIRMGFGCAGTTNQTNKPFVFSMPQVEIGSYATSYIPTSGSAATRSADVCNSAGTSAEFNDSEGVLYAEITALANDSTNRIISVSDGSGNNRGLIKYDNSSNTIEASLTDGGVDQASLSHSYTITNTAKIAFKYKANDFALWVNGSEVDTDSSGTTPSGLDTLNFDNGSGGSDFYGKCKQLIYFNEALSDSELQTLTS